MVYVFDFYNLYIPKGTSYLNASLGIRIKPLKLAEEFERNRTHFSQPYYRGGWKTAQCHIRAKTQDEAKRVANWLECLYSFAQSRNVFFVRSYEYKRGSKYFSFESKFLHERENRFSDLIFGVNTTGNCYSSDISLFVDTALQTLAGMKEQSLNEMLTLLRAYLISQSEIVVELQFLIGWIALEKMANSFYSVYKSKNSLFKKNELNNLKNKIYTVLEEHFNGDKRLGLIKRNMSRNFLFDHNTLQKLFIYFESISLCLEDKSLALMLDQLITVRQELVHNLNSQQLLKKPYLINMLQTIMEDTIFRLLGINVEKQKMLMLTQNNVWHFDEQTKTHQKSLSCKLR